MAEIKKRTLFGPGFLVTAAFIGPGTVTACSRAGAGFGFTLIYVLVFATVITILLQEMTGRLSIGSGMDLGQSLRDFPKKKLTRILFAVLTFSAIIFGCAAYEAGNIIGGSLGLEMATPFPQKLWVVIIFLGAFAILITQKTRLIEKFLISLVFVMSVSFVATVILIKPDFGNVLKSLIPSFPPESPYVILALVGTTVVPYNLFLHSSTVKEKWKDKSDLKRVRMDLLLAVGLGGMISIAIIITSAETFYMNGAPLEEGTQLALQLKDLFGPAKNLVFGIGFFAAGLSSAITAPYAAAYASSGIFGWKDGKKHQGFTVVWMSVLIIGFIISLFNFKPLAVIMFAQVANGFVLPIVSIFLLVVLNKKERMGSLANNKVQNIWGALVILIVSCLGLWNIFKIEAVANFLKKLLGF